MSTEEAQQNLDMVRQSRDDAREALDTAIYEALEARQSASSLLDAYRQDPSPDLRSRWIRSMANAKVREKRAETAAQVYEAYQGEYLRLRAAGESYTVEQITAAYARCGVPHGALDTKTLIETLRGTS